MGSLLPISESTTTPSGWTRRTPPTSNVEYGEGPLHAMGTSYGTARRRPRGRARPAGVALTSRGRCRGRRCGRWTSRSEACRRARYGRKWTRRDGGREVLADRRLRRSAAKSLSEKDEDAGQRLDHLPVKSLTFSCEWCGQCATLKVAELIAMFGRERNVRSIGRHVLKCRDRRSRREGDECPMIIFQA